MNHFDTIIIGTGPAGLGAAFHLADHDAKSILLMDKSAISSGGLRNDCKQNYTFPVGFPLKIWEKNIAELMLKKVEKHLNPHYEKMHNIEIYETRAQRLDVQLIPIKQSHVGTDHSVELINSLIDSLKKKGATVSLKENAYEVHHDKKILVTNKSEYSYKNLIIAPGRAGFSWLQKVMDNNEISYIDNEVDVGIRVETRFEHYPIVKDYYDPKFLFPGGVRTFCTNSGSAHIVKEKYETYYSVNGHSFSTDRKANGLVNFAMLKTIRLTDPVVSGHDFAAILGQMAMQLSGGQPMMQRVGDFRMGRRSKKETFNDDLYDFEPTLKGATPGDITLAMPAKILRAIWKSLKMLDTIVPGVLHPSTIMYYPEIKTYALRPEFTDDFFGVKKNLYMIGDGAGTSRGITAAWASGIRAAMGVLKNQ